MGRPAARRVALPPLAGASPAAEALHPGAQCTSRGSWASRSSHRNSAGSAGGGQASAAGTATSAKTGWSETSPRNARRLRANQLKLALRHSVRIWTALDVLRPIFATLPLHDLPGLHRRRRAVPTARRRLHPHRASRPPRCNRPRGNSEDRGQGGCPPGQSRLHCRPRSMPPSRRRRRSGCRRRHRELLGARRTANGWESAADTGASAVLFPA